MKTLFSKKNIKTLSILLIIDIIMVGCWTLYTQPDESMTIILLFIIPIVFLTNLVIAGIFYFIKMYYTPFLVINAFLSSFLVYLFLYSILKLTDVLIWIVGSFLLTESNIPYRVTALIEMVVIIVSNIALNRVYQLVVRMKEELFSLETILYILLP